MLVVIASGYDEAAKRVVRAWRPAGARLCTPADLSVAGWRHRVQSPADGRAVIEGRVTPVAEITGVWTRLPRIEPAELNHIAATDRAYVAAEMTSFLIAFLSALSCPVLNRPTAASLSGPGWRPEQWIRAAILAGIPVRLAQRRVQFADARDPPVAGGVEFTIVGDRVFGPAEPALAGWATRLAKASGVRLLGVRLARHGDGYALGGVNPWPAIDFPGGQNAIRDELLGCSNCWARQ